jgi:hypothetical protein
LHKPATDFPDGEPVPAEPRKDLADHAGLLRHEGRARLAPTGMLGDVTVARGRAAEPIDGAQTGGMEFAPAVTFDNLGPFIFGHHPLHLAQ